MNANVNYKALSATGTPQATRDVRGSSLIYTVSNTAHWPSSYRSMHGSMHAKLADWRLALLHALLRMWVLQRPRRVTSRSPALRLYVCTARCPPSPVRPPALTPALLVLVEARVPVLPNMDALLVLVEARVPVRGPPGAHAHAHAHAHETCTCTTRPRRGSRARECSWSCHQAASRRAAPSAGAPGRPHRRRPHARRPPRAASGRASARPCRVSSRRA